MRIIFTVMALGCLTCSWAQPGGRRGGDFDPKEMVLREKENVITRVDSLSEDQLLLLDGIYDEYATSVVEIRDEARKNRNFREMRPKMQALREEKDLLLKDVLNENQYEAYLALMENQRDRRRRGVQQRRDSVNQQPNG
ncbi:MAG: hypothetical protein ACFB2Y_15310 [Fulvivirga sp.]